MQVIVLNLDLEHQRVGLSMKRLADNPWDTVEEQLCCGDEVTGRVAGVERFGVFVELFSGVEGLLHVSELEGEVGYDSEPGGYEVGQEIAVRVLEIMPHEHRIALGLPMNSLSYGAAS